MGSFLQQSMTCIPFLMWHQRLHMWHQRVHVISKGTYEMCGGKGTAWRKICITTDCLKGAIQGDKLYCDRPINDEAMNSSWQLPLIVPRFSMPVWHSECTSGLQLSCFGRWHPDSSATIQDHGGTWRDDGCDDRRNALTEEGCCGVWSI